MGESAAFEDLLNTLPKPAQRAIQSAKVASIEEIYEMGKEKLLALHGFGPGAIKKIEAFTGRKLNE